MLSCFFLLTPAVTVPDMTLAARVASALYPAMDLLVLTMALFLAIGGGRRMPSDYLLGGALGCVLLTDTIYTTLQLYGTYSAGDALDAGWLVSYLLLGAAALHPSMTALSQPGSEALPALLRHVARLEPDFIKLDRSLVDAVDTGRTARLIASAFAGLAAAMGAEIIAEGVERPGQLATLRDLGIRFGQGFLLGRPRPIGERRDA